MMPSLLVAAAMTAPGAPVPKDTVPNTTGPAPRIAAVKADAGGVVWVTAHIYQKQKVQQQFVVVENGKQVVKQQEVEQTVATYVRKSLGDFGGKFNTADGMAISAEEATRRVKDGATLLITADGKPVDMGWLKAVNDDAVVMTAEGLAEAHFTHGYAPFPMTAAPRLVMLGTDDKGEVRVPVNANAGNANAGVYYGNFRGRANFGGQIMIQADDGFVAAGPPAAATSPGSDGKKALADIRFDAYDVNGKMVSRAEALNRLKAGGLVVLAGDNRFPDADYLKAFRDDLLVITSAELVFPAGQPNPFDRPVPKPAAGAAKPANAAAPVQIAPAVGVAAPAVIIKRAQVQVQVEK